MSNLEKSTTNQIDPFSDSISCLLVIVFTKSSSKNFPLALDIASGADAFKTAKINNVDTYCACFGTSNNEALRALAFLNYAAEWKGLQIFQNGKVITHSFHAIQVLSCYQKSQRCRDKKAHCHKIIDDPFNKDIKTINSGSFSFSFTTEPDIFREIEVDRYSFPCSHLYDRFHFQSEHPSTVQDQIQASAVDNGCDWCPNFNPDDWGKVGITKFRKKIE